jgi:hypothetical protein
MDAEQQGTFAALAVPNFRRYVSGQSLSLVGTWVQTVAEALLVPRLTHSGKSSQPCGWKTRKLQLRTPS